MPGVVGNLKFLKTEESSIVSIYPLYFMERGLALAGVPSLSNHQGGLAANAARVLGRLRLPRNVQRGRGVVLVGMMGISEFRVIPFAVWREIVPFCFDCWPKDYERWTSFFTRYRVRLAFFTARQSAENFAERLPGMKCVWMPEATDPEEYDASRTWSKRDIDVLELGRKSDRFHESVVGPLASAGRVHLYEKVKGQVVFPGKAEFFDGIARSKMLVCFPSSQTHPERSGTVETVTHRYFEGMASRCLLVGHGPQELTDLFGYNPVVEMQAGREAEQIEEILRDPESLAGLVERNYQRLLEVGSWTTRAQETLAVIGEFPF